MPRYPPAKGKRVPAVVLDAEEFGRIASQGGGGGRSSTEGAGGRRGGADGGSARGRRAPADVVSIAPTKMSQCTPTRCTIAARWDGLSGKRQPCNAQGCSPPGPVAAEGDSTPGWSLSWSTPPPRRGWEGGASGCEPEAVRPRGARLGAPLGRLSPTGDQWQRVPHCRRVVDARRDGLPRPRRRHRGR